MEDYRTRQRHHKSQQPDNMLRLRNMLNIAFMLLALVGVIIYFAANETVGTVVILVAMVFKIVECCIRMIYKK